MEKLKAHVKYKKQIISVIKVNPHNRINLVILKQNIFNCLFITFLIFIAGDGQQKTEEVTSRISA
jgi:hypothetical protein